MPSREMDSPGTGASDHVVPERLAAIDELPALVETSPTATHEDAPGHAIAERLAPTWPDSSGSTDAVSDVPEIAMAMASEPGLSHAVATASHEPAAQHEMLTGATTEVDDGAGVSCVDHAPASSTATTSSVPAASDPMAVQSDASTHDTEESDVSAAVVGSMVTLQLPLSSVQ